MFSKEDEDTFQSLSFNVRNQTLMHMQEENKRKKRKRKRKEDKTQETKVR